MIELVDNIMYMTYRYQIGPFFIFFYHKSQSIVKDLSNLALLRYLRCIEMKYSDLPMLGFEFSLFISTYKAEKVTSVNNILVIQRDKPSLVYQTYSFSEIDTILEKIRKERLSFRMSRNKKYAISKSVPIERMYYKNRNSCKQKRIHTTVEQRIKDQNRIMGIDDIESDSNKALPSFQPNKSPLHIFNSEQQNINLKRTYNDLENISETKKYSKIIEENCEETSMILSPVKNQIIKPFNSNSKQNSKLKDNCKQAQKLSHIKESDNNIINGVRKLQSKSKISCLNSHNQYPLSFKLDHTKIFGDSKSDLPNILIEQKNNKKF